MPWTNWTDNLINLIKNRINKSYQYLLEKCFVHLPSMFFFSVIMSVANEWMKKN